MRFIQGLRYRHKRNKKFVILIQATTYLVLDNIVGDTYIEIGSVNPMERCEGVRKFVPLGGVKQYRKLTK
jgi:hypothetical protein